MPCSHSGPHKHPPSPTWRRQSLSDAARLTWTVQGPSEQGCCWQCLSSWFPGLIGSGRVQAWPAQAGSQRTGRGGGAVMCLPSWANMDPAQHLFPALHLGPSHLCPRCPLVGPVTNSPAGLPEGLCALCLYFSEMERLIRHHLWGSVPPSRVICGLPCLCPHTVLLAPPLTQEDPFLPQGLCTVHAPACYTFL